MEKTIAATAGVLLARSKLPQKNVTRYDFLVLSGREKSACFDRLRSRGHGECQNITERWEKPAVLQLLIGTRTNSFITDDCALLERWRKPLETLEA